MQTHQLKRIHPNTKRMIVARGGKRGKTAGRGGKGQSARAGNKRRPEWRDIIKKLPKLRGRGVSSFKSYSIKPEIVNLSALETSFKAGESVTPTTIVEKGILSTLSGKIPTVKILGDGELTKSLNISGCFISTSAKEKIEKAGGVVTLLVVKEEVVAPVAKVASAPVVDEVAESTPKAKKETKKSVDTKKEAKPVKKVEKKNVKK
jgi:large subunit ribosomal protein L15